MADILTWNSSLDNEAADYSSTIALSKSLIFEIHKFILGTGAWVAVESCAFVGGAQTVGAGNLFSSTFVIDEWVNGTGVHSWIKYYCAGLDMYMIIDLYGTASSYPWTVTYSPTLEPTGGTTSSRPTSTLEWSYSSGSSILQLHDNTANLNRVNGVYSTRGDFWIWIYKTGRNIEHFGMALTSICDPDPIKGDNYPTLSYQYYDTSYGAFSSSLAYGYGLGWKGRTGGGNLVGSTNALTFCEFVRVDSTYGAYPISATRYWPSAGGQWRGGHFKVDFNLWVNDTAGIYTDYKGKLPDVMWAPRITVGTPMDDPVTRRCIGNLWLPGMPISGPIT